MRFLLASIGSAGDLNPVLGIATVLRSRGHDVAVAANEVYQQSVVDTGATYLPLGSRTDHERATSNPDAWHPRKGIEILAKQLVVPQVAPLVEHIRAAGPQTIVAGTSLALGARVAEDTLGNPTATLHLQPAMFRSLVAPPVSQGFAAITRIPIPLRRLAYWWIDRIVDPLFAPAIETRSVLGRYIHSPNLTLGLFPAWFAPPQVDWPRSELIDFVRYDGKATALDPDLDAWLADGTPPIVFTGGTAMHHARPLFEAAITACTRLGRRGIILASKDVPALPSTMRHVAFAPLAALAKRSALLVHHGGVGTAARAIEAGIPHVVIPMAHDQFDNARRLASLGVSVTLDRERVATEFIPALTAALALDASALVVNWRSDGAERAADRLSSL